MLAKPFCVVFISFVVVGIAWTQEPSKGQEPSKTKPDVPVTMTQCEGSDHCAEWSFLGIHGNGQGPSGEVENLTVQKSDADHIVIERADSTGSSAGLTATYTGTRKGTTVEGTFTSSWPGHWENATGTWTATIGKTEKNLPAIIRTCDYPRYNYCNTMTWNKDHYDFLASNGQTGKYTVLSFTRDSVTWRGTMDSLPNFVSMSTGKITDGNRIIVGDWSDNLGRVGHFTAAWGAAINSVPAAALTQNAPPVVVARPVVVCYPWFFVGVVCQ